MTWARRDDERANFELGEEGWRDGVVADDCNVCSEQRELLVKIPSEGIKVVNHEHIELAGQRWGKRRRGHGAERSWFGNAGLFSPNS